MPHVDRFLRRSLYEEENDAQTWLDGDAALQANLQLVLQKHGPTHQHHIRIKVLQLQGGEDNKNFLP